jgi:hypothetical protein
MSNTNQDRMALVALTIILFAALFCVAAIINASMKPWSSDEEFKIVKITVEPCEKDRCYDNDGTHYRVFTLGRKSMWKVPAAYSGLYLSQKEYSYLHYMQYGDDERSRNRYYEKMELYLLPCSKFSDTKRYLIKSGFESSSALMGLVYSRRSFNEEYQIKEEDLLMPCLKGA